MKQKVKIIVPLYKERLSEQEDIVLSNNMLKLATHPVVFLRPEGLDMRFYTDRYPQAEIMTVSPDWLGANGIAGYNVMMLSKSFYERFADTEYILICHTDAWIFSDDLLAWCEKGYDVVAAPWPTRSRYRHFPLKQLLAVERGLLSLCGGMSRHLLCGKVGNGGLSLRRVEAFIRACETYQAEIARYNSLSDPLHNEDVFWAIVPQEFHYPPEDEALKFAFDRKPWVCYRLTGGQLPMGCHGFTGGHRRLFWQAFLPFLRDQD